MADQIKVKSKGKPIKSDPLYLGTKPIRLPKAGKMGKSRIVAVQMYLPPGVSRFFIERLNTKEIRFLILTEEVNRMAKKAEEMMEANPNQFSELPEAKEEKKVN